MISDLINKGHLYSITVYQARGYPDSSWDSLIALGPSVPDNVQQTWDIKASHNIGPQGSNKSHNMRSYHCTMNASSVDWILSLMGSESTLTEWYLKLGSMMGGNNGPRAANITAALTSTLEAMVMIGWGDQVNITTVLKGDPTQGCVISYAEIPWPLFTILILATICALLMIIYSIVLSAMDVGRRLCCGSKSLMD